MRSVLRCVPLVLLFTVSMARAQDASIRVGGSTTALPIISSCAAAFMDKFGVWDKAEAGLGKEQAVIYVTGGGSGFGVKGLMNGTIDVGLVSRDLRESEIKTLGGPVMHVFARDAVAIATSTANPLAKTKQDFTVAELVTIFSGQARELSNIDSRLPAKGVVLLTRDASGGVTEIFQERVMKKERLAATRLQFPSTAALIKKLETTDTAIAFVSAGAVVQDSLVRTYAVEGVAPTQENIMNGSYTLNRPMLIVAKPNPSRKAQVFMDYVLGECQKTVKEMGFVPARTVK